MKFYALNLICLSLFIFSACGKHSGDDGRSGSVHIDPNLNAPLMKELHDIQTSEWVSDCDLTWSSIKTELVTVLVSKEKELEQSSGAGTEQSSAHQIKFAGSYLDDLPQVVPTSSEWTNYTYSWKSVYEFYRRNVKEPYPEFWQDLNFKVRSLLLEDKKRVIWSSNDGIDHLSAPHFKTFYNSIRKCEQDENCVAIDLSADEIKILNSIPFYAFRLKELNSTAETSKKRELIRSFSKRVTNDAVTILETVHPKLTLKSDEKGGHFTLGIDPGTLSREDQQLVKSTIESVWQSDKADFTLNFTTQQQDPDLFQILFHLDQPGRRYFVQWSSKTMNLFPGGEVRPIAHEFGHVLGFRDHYYTIWKSNQCEYTQESNPMDFMSDSSNGNVTEDEWKFLFENAMRKN